jgi:hypothetical protein
MPTRMSRASCDHAQAVSTDSACRRGLVIEWISIKKGLSRTAEGLIATRTKHRLADRGHATSARDARGRAAVTRQGGRRPRPSQTLELRHCSAEMLRLARCDRRIRFRLLARSASRALITTGNLARSLRLAGERLDGGPAENVGPSAVRAQPSLRTYTKQRRRHCAASARDAAVGPAGQGAPDPRALS